MMSNLMKNDECQPFGPKLRVKGKPPIQCDNSLFSQYERLRIDDREIELELEYQIGEGVSEIVEEVVEQSFSAGVRRLEHLSFGQSFAEKHGCINSSRSAVSREYLSRPAATQPRHVSRRMVRKVME